MLFLPFAILSLVGMNSPIAISVERMLPVNIFFYLDFFVIKS